MKTSTALQFDASELAGELSVRSNAIAHSGTGGLQSNTIKLPTFGGYVYAATARKAGRVNARAISDAEQDALLTERQTLLDAVFDGTATRKEERRLEYIRWSLDRIEDAKHGEHLDRLEEVVVRYEHFLKDLQALREQLEGGSK
ncbi:hypothetical protein [Phenylobacterium sp. Root700]|uniref:hypothetical protein n=1 Tax=Phenylobacterium sp. Root700 TaxID=1736591 RepID=UPI0006FAECE9|nr:hypothetical protein [Phenylobacterium sp. Root700]KRB40990.1 hypothetical protein ASE02_06375 [Phenylobacterium sp. Root700]